MSVYKMYLGDTVITVHDSKVEEMQEKGWKLNPPKKRAESKPKESTKTDAR